MPGPVMGDRPKPPVGGALGKGAWDCDNNCEIPPEKEAIVFEEIATMDFPFEGIPTIPPRKDMDHFAFYCDGCRYRIKGNIDECAIDLKKRLWDGGLGRGNDMTTGRRKRIAKWEDIVLIYAGQQFADDIPLREFHVPPGCKVMLAVDKRILEQDKPDPDSSYWL